MIRAAISEWCISHASNIQIFIGQVKHCIFKNAVMFLCSMITKYLTSNYYIMGSETEKYEFVDVWVATTFSAYSKLFTGTRQ